MDKPTLCLDFDGVIHSYESGWLQPYFIPDPPVKGALAFLHEAVQHFDVKIYSSRSGQDGGVRAMMVWLEYWARKELTNVEPTYAANAVINAICWNKNAWPMTKPSAFLTIDDRGWTFNGQFPSIDEIKRFKPWNKGGGWVTRENQTPFTD